MFTPHNIKASHNYEHSLNIFLTHQKIEENALRHAEFGLIDKF